MSGDALRDGLAAFLAKEWGCPVEVELVGVASAGARRRNVLFDALRDGKRVPLVGLVSMDIALADVTDVPDVEVGDAAVLLGRASGGVSISASEYGSWSGLSEYEVTCGMSKRVPRTYVEAR